MMATAYQGPGAAVDWHSGGGDRRLDRPLTGFAMNPARDFGPKLFTGSPGGQYRHDRGRDIPYFIVPIIAPLLGACLGAAIYRFLIALSTCVEEENTR